MKWKIRYDIMRRLPGAEFQSVCMHPSDEMGFETIGEANDVLKMLEAADGTLGTSAPTRYDIWPMAVHEDFGKMTFDDGTDEDGDVQNGSNYS